ETGSFHAWASFFPQRLRAPIRAGSAVSDRPTEAAAGWAAPAHRRTHAAQPTWPDIPARRSRHGRTDRRGWLPPHGPDAAPRRTRVWPVDFAGSRETAPVSAPGPDRDSSRVDDVPGAGVREAAAPGLPPGERKLIGALPGVRVPALTGPAQPSRRSPDSGLNR